MIRWKQDREKILPFPRRCVVLHVGFIFSIIRRRVVTLLLAQQTDGQTTKQFYRDYWLTVIGNIDGLKPGYPLIKFIRGNVFEWIENF